MRVEKATDSLWRRVIWPTLWPLLLAQVGLLLLCLLAWLLVWRIDAQTEAGWSSLSWLLLVLAVGTCLSAATFLLLLRHRLQQWESSLSVPYERLERLLGMVHGSLPPWLKADRLMPEELPAQGPVRRLEQLLDALENLMERMSKRPKFATMLDRLTIPAFITRDDVLVEANGAFEQLIGRSASELRGLDLAYLVRQGLGDEAHVQKIASMEVVRVNDSRGGYRSFRLLSLEDGHGHRMGLLEDIVDQQQQLAQLTLSRDHARQESKLKTGYLQMLQKELADLMQVGAMPGVTHDVLRERLADLETLVTNLVESHEAVTSEGSASFRQAASGSSSVGRGVSQGEPARVLIVDDGPVNTMLARQVLEAEGMHVDTAKGGMEALAMGEAKRYDLVFMDIFMQDLDGVETSRRWRMREQGQRDRSILVALTANAGETDRQRFFDAGMDDFLAKPYRPQALVAMVRRWLLTNL